jgi:hypothetical protein
LFPYAFPVTPEIMTALHLHFLKLDD